MIFYEFPYDDLQFASLLHKLDLYLGKIFG